MSKKKFNGKNAKGYYIALILCAVAIGISGYLFFRNADAPEESLESVPVLTVPKELSDVQAVATEPRDHEPEATPEATQPTTRPKEKPVSPVSGQVLHSYAMDALSYNQTTRDWRTHNGIDIAAEAGTPVAAAAAGTVYTVYEDDSMGTTIVIRHSDGYITTYASLDAKTAVSAGDTVTAGQTVGYVGTSALVEMAIGDHVHFSVSCNGEPVDPEEFLLGS